LIIANIEPSWHNSVEHKACSLGGLRCSVAAVPQIDTISIGSVEYCRKAHPWPACDPYPGWLPWGRNIYRGEAPDKTLFYKPADIPKRFTSCVMESPPDGDWVASDPVIFVKEWRAYVVHGKVTGIFCYSDFECDEPREFPWVLPNITAAVDFGMTDDGHILPVEVNDPYAIGWYGSLSQYQIYADFVIAGWQLMLDPHGKKY